MNIDKANVEAEKYKKDMQIAIAKQSMSEHYAEELTGEEDDYMLENPSSYYDAALDKDLDDIIGNYAGTANYDSFNMDDWL